MHIRFSEEVTVTTLKPSWTKQQQAAGKRMREAWEEFFSKKSDETPGQPRPALSEDARIAAVQARHEAELLRYPNVVGVAPGIKVKRGKPAGVRCLVVYVKRKLPRAALSKSDILPSELEGVPVKVVEIGKVEALSTDLPS